MEKFHGDVGESAEESRTYWTLPDSYAEVWYDSIARNLEHYGGIGYISSHAPEKQQHCWVHPNTQPAALPC